MTRVDASASDALGRIAAIDVGTNTVRLVVADVRADRSFRIVDDEKVTTRLGRGMAESGRLDKQAMDETAEAIANLLSIADGYGVSARRIAATCAVREAENGREFVRRVRDRTGTDVEVISAEDEGRLAYLSVSSAFDLRGVPAAVVDVGGGSTEVVLSSGPVIERIYPLRMGAVRLTEMFGLTGVPDSEQTAEVRRWIRRQLSETIGKLPFVPHLVVGTGGTFTNLASIVLRRRGPTAALDDDMAASAVRGFEMQRSDVKHVLHMLREMDPRERAKVPGLSPDRADIIVGGIEIVDCLLKHLRANRLRVHDQGIRAGLLQTMIDEKYPRAGRSRPVDRRRSVERLAAACPHDERHAEHVTALALELFDGLAAVAPDDAWATIEDRELLEAAARLHDIGYFISYERHHKHSYHLIMHSGLEGFTRAELELIAAIARYHRGARPKPGHRGYARLADEDRMRVTRLAGILRLAVGLDRAHAQIVRSVTVACCTDAIEIGLVAGRNPVAELWGVDRKASLLKRAFGMPIRCRWVAGNGSGATPAAADGAPPKPSRERGAPSSAAGAADP